MGNLASLSTSNTKLDRLLSITLFLLVLDRLWGFVFKRTIYSSSAMVYLSFVTLLFLFLVLFFKAGKNRWNNISLLWLPYFMITILGYTIRFSIENVSYWIISFICLLIAQYYDLYKAIPYKVFFWSGIFALSGIAVQLFFPSFYASHISGLFVNDENLENWMDHYGLAGFTYQLDVTARILLYGEFVLIYMKDIFKTRLFNKKIVYYSLIFLIIVGVFLTGKRLLSVISIFIPILVYFFSSKKNLKLFFLFLFLFVISYFGFQYFVSHIYEFTDNILLRRFVESYFDVSSGADLTSGRAELYQLAWKAFYDSPLTGVGIGNYMGYTGAYTEVHNTYLQVLCEQGIVGFTFYIVPIFVCFLQTVKLIRKTYASPWHNYLKLSLAIQLFYIIYSMTGNENIGTGFVVYFLFVALVIYCEATFRNAYRQKKSYENCYIG